MLFVAATAVSSYAQLQDQCLGGQPDAPIKLEVFSDLQCPACRSLYLDTVKPVLKDYASKDKVCVVYREFPLQMHQHARAAARYSQAAQRLGREKWLAVLEALFTNQAQWSKDGMLEATVAKALSPEDFQKLKKHLEDPEINKAIDHDVELGMERKIQSTPTLFVSAIGKEERVEGPIPYPILKDYFDRIVK
jgi:protein-disulfide isomerase